MACHGKVDVELSCAHVVSQVGHHCIEDTKAQQWKPWVVFRYRPGEIHLPLMEGTFQTRNLANM